MIVHCLLPIAALVQIGTMLPLQPDRPARDEPSLNDPRLKEIVNELDTARKGSVVVKPDSLGSLEPVRPGLAGMPEARRKLGEGRSPLFPEGTFIRTRRGRAFDTPTGELAFAFDRDESGEQPNPMVLLPGRHMALLEQLRARAGTNTRMLLTGRVMAYHGLNYIVVTAPPKLATIEPRPETTPQATPTEPVPAQPDADEPDAASDPRVTDLIRNLESSAPERQVLQRRAEAEANANIQRAPLAEGTFINARRGRIVRSSSGLWLFTPDNGTAQPASPSEPPMILLPSMNLAELERLAERFGDGISVTASGEVFAYHGRNYMLVTMFTVHRSGSGLTPLQ